VTLLQLAVSAVVVLLFLSAPIGWAYDRLRKRGER